MDPLKQLESQECRDSIRDFQKTGDYRFLEDVLPVIQRLATHIINRKHWYRYKQDMVQEVMFHIINKSVFDRCDLDKPNTVARFLYRVCFNKMVSYLRKQRHHQHLSLDDAAEKYRSDIGLVKVYNSDVSYSILSPLERDIFVFCVRWFQMHNSTYGMVPAVVEVFRVRGNRASRAVKRIVSNAFNERRLNYRNLRTGSAESILSNSNKESEEMPEGKTLADLQRERMKNQGKSKEEAKPETLKESVDEDTGEVVKKAPPSIDVRRFSRKLPELSDEQKAEVRGKKKKAQEQNEKTGKLMKDDLSRYLQVMDEEQLVKFAISCGVDEKRLDRYVKLFKKSNALARMNLYAAVRSAILH